MEFCPKCGAILFQEKKGSKCPRCSYSSKEKIKIVTSEKIEEKKETIISKETDSEVRPIVQENCEKCKNKQAYFWTVQTRAGDEAETKFFKCTKCRHTWREYR